MKIPLIKARCDWMTCSDWATDIVQGYDRRQVGYYCGAHAEVVVNEQSPEYTVSCPNCTCRFGVN